MLKKLHYLLAWPIENIIGLMIANLRSKCDDEGEEAMLRVTQIEKNRRRCVSIQEWGGGLNDIGGFDESPIYLPVVMFILLNVNIILIESNISCLV